MARATRYAQRAREQFDRDGDKAAFIKTVWNEALTRSGKSHIVEKATKAILSLTKSEGKDLWIKGKEILKSAGIKGFRQNLSYGLWPWLDERGAGVIEENGQWPDISYRIKGEFYETMKTLIKT